MFADFDLQAETAITIVISVSCGSFEKRHVPLSHIVGLCAIGWRYFGPPGPSDLWSLVKADTIPHRPRRETRRSLWQSASLTPIPH